MSIFYSSPLLLFLRFVPLLFFFAPLYADDVLRTTYSVIMSDGSIFSSPANGLQIRPVDDTTQYVLLGDYIKSQPILPNIQMGDVTFIESNQPLSATINGPIFTITNNIPYYTLNLQIPIPTFPKVDVTNDTSKPLSVTMKLSNTGLYDYQILYNIPPGPMGPIGPTGPPGKNIYPLPAPVPQPTPQPQVLEDR